MTDELTRQRDEAIDAATAEYERERVKLAAAMQAKIEAAWAAWLDHLYKKAA